MFEFIFSAQFLIGLVLGAVGGAFLGVLLGRRSTTANAYVDSILREKDRAVQKVRELEAQARDKH